MEVTKRNFFTNVLWRFLERIGAQTVSFIVSIILARLIAPEYYGKIALITVFTAILQVFVDSGLGNALIQKKDADDLDFSTVFFTNIAFCIVLYGLLFIAAPFIAKFYSDEQFTILVRVLGLTLVISSVKNVLQAYVAKNMIFKKFFFATLFGTIVSAIVGVCLAYKGFGVWALITQQLTNLFIDTFVLWIIVPWKPALQFSFERLKQLFSFGWKLLLSAIITTIYSKLRQLIIGKKYTSTDLAYYNKAEVFPNIIVANIDTSLNSVLFSAMASSQDNVDIVKSMARRTLKVSTYIMSPLMIGLAVTAPSVIKLLLTDKWMFCAPYLRVFCIYYMFYPIFTVNLNAINAMGRSDLFLKIEIAKKTVGFAVLMSSMWFGVWVMACCLLIENLSEQIIDSFPNRKLINYSYFAQMKDILPNILLAVFMGVCVYFVHFLNIVYWAQLIIQIILGAFIYITGSFIFKLESFTYLLDMWKKRK